MSPEIFKNKPYNHKSDIWALGCVLYEMVTLKHAFDGSSINQLASKIIKGRFPPISSRYSSHLTQLITSMLNTNPNKRPSIERILKLPFIKRHIQDFISDIANRAETSIGDGTSIIKVAALNLCENGGGGRVGGEVPEVESLRNQLSSLGMANVIAKATGNSLKEGEDDDDVTTTSSSSAAVPPSLRLQNIKEEHSSKSNIANRQPPSSVSRDPPLSSRRHREQCLAKEKSRALSREEERKKVRYKKNLNDCY